MIPKRSQVMMMGCTATHRSRYEQVCSASGATRVFVFTAWFAVCCVYIASTHAQDQAEPPQKAPTDAATQVDTKSQPTHPDNVSAREAVRLGNKQLLAGDAQGALGHYADAERLEPNAPQIAYVKGLGYFAAKNYREARQAFEQAAASKNDQLAGDAIYGAGITYHAEALAAHEDPKVAIGKLESALERYRTVLAHNPDHQAAKDAAVKAATLRRQLVQQVQQQKSESDDKPKDNDKQKKNENKEKKEEQQPGKQDEDKQQDQQQEGDKQKEQPSSKDEESKNKDSEKSESKDSDKQDQSDDQKSADASKSDKSSDDAQQQQQADTVKENAEKDNKQQAQRRLREMMDAMRNRKKRRPAQQLPTPIKPVDKDW